jgi:hypothetical protein
MAEVIRDQMGNIREYMPLADWPTKEFGQHGKVIEAYRWITDDDEQVIVAEEYLLESGRRVIVGPHYPEPQVK